jgi:hypothetical protein
MSLRGAALLDAEYRFPPFVVVFCHGSIVRREGAFDCYFGRVVAVEEGGVDFDACDLAASDT